MILNPPSIFRLLRAWMRMGASETPKLLPYQLTVALAVMLRECIGHQSWDSFLKTYQLYLQSIPFETAKAAWGINAAAASRTTHKTKP